MKQVPRGTGVLTATVTIRPSRSISGSPVSWISLLHDKLRVTTSSFANSWLNDNVMTVGEASSDEPSTGSIEFSEFVS